jgi:hypothetical protein
LPTICDASNEMASRISRSTPSLGGPYPVSDIATPKSDPSYPQATERAHSGLGEPFLHLNAI